MKRIGLQLYTLRDILAIPEKTDECLKKIKMAGYDEAQLYGGFGDMERIGAASLANGLEIIGSTMPFDLMYNDPEKTMELHRKFGTNHIGIGIYRYADNNEVFEFIKKANKLCDIFAENGFMLSYHNHSHEFVKSADNKTIFDMLIENFNERMNFCLDTYWVQHGGGDIRFFIEKLKNRIDILHLKDMKRVLTPEKVNFAEIGRGNLYWEGIIATAEKCGVKHYVVEQDKCDNDPMESALISSKYLHDNFMEE